MQVSTRAVLALGLALLTLGGLSGCAPASGATSNSLTQSVQSNQQGQQASLPFQADFSDAGVTWVSGGQAYIARAPGFALTHAPLPTPAVAVSWAGGVAWAALPDIGQVITLDGPVQQLRAPQAWKLSHTRIYARNGAEMDYSGAAVSGLPFGPQAVVTGTDGQDYALLDGKIYRNAAPLPALLPTAPLAQAADCAGTVKPANTAPSAAYLYATPTGAAWATCPTLQTQQGLYRLNLAVGELQQLVGADVLRRVAYPVPAGVQAALGQVGGSLVALRSDGQIRVFLPDLREVTP